MLRHRVATVHSGGDPAAAALQAGRRQLVSVSKAEQEVLCHGHAYFGQAGEDTLSTHSQVTFTGSPHPRSATSISPSSSCFVGIVSAGRASRGRLPALDTGHSATPTANTRRQTRQRHRDRHVSKLALRFHHGRRLLTESTAPHCGHATSKAVSRANAAARRGDRDVDHRPRG